MSLRGITWSFIDWGGAFLGWPEEGGICLSNDLKMSMLVKLAQS